LVEQCWVLAVLWLIVRLDVEVSHLLVEVGLLLLCLLLGLLLLFLCFLLSLHGSELVENVFVVKNSVTEFIFEILFIQKFLSLLSDDVHLEQLVD